MAVRLALNTSPTEILKTVQAWVKLLEQEDYQNAAYLSGIPHTCAQVDVYSATNKSNSTLTDALP